MERFKMHNCDWESKLTEEQRKDRSAQQSKCRLGKKTPRSAVEKILVSRGYKKYGVCDTGGNLLFIGWPSEIESRFGIPARRVSEYIKNPRTQRIKNSGYHIINAPTFD